MIVHQCAQGSDEWLSLHVGVVTASRFSRLVTPKTRKISSQIHSVACEVAAEWMVGGSNDSAVTQFMTRGIKLEKQAAAWYAFDRGVEVVPVGFVTLDDGSAGCSPDGLVGDDGGVEIKSPSAVKHVEYLTDHKALLNEYYAQCQGGLWICKRTWWDLVSFHPTIPKVVVPVTRDEKYIAVLSEAVAAVNAEVDAILRKHGFKE